MKDLTPGAGHTETSSNSVVSFPATHGKNYQEYVPVEATYVEENEINLRDLFQVLVSRRWVVLIFFLIIVSVTIIGTFLAPPVFRASLTLQINRDSQKVLNYQDVTSSESIYEKDYYQTQYELLKSRSLAQRVIDQMGLEKNRFFNKGDKHSSDSNNTSQKNVEHLDKRRELVDNFLANLTIEPIKRSRLVKIHYESPDPKLSAQISNVIASNYINLNLERRFDASVYAKTFIEDRLRQVKVSLEDSEKELIKFARENEIINIDDKRPILVKQLQQVNTTLAKAEEERVKAEALYQEMLETKGQGLNVILDSAIVQELKQTKAKLDSEYQDKLNVFKPSYPLMIQLQNRINAVQKKINSEVDTIRSAIYSSYMTQKREENILLKRLTELKEQVLALQDRSIQYNVLKRETDTNKQLYQGLLQRLKEVSVTGGITTNNITIIDSAEVPSTKYKPNLLLNTLLAVIFGFIGGVILAFFFEYFDDTVKAPDDLEKQISLPVLGLVPELNKMSALESPNEHDVGLISFYDPRSAIAEAYRSTRTALQFSTPTGAPKVLLVTSASPGEGKTTSALNIAITFSQLGKSVLLIDTDLRNPSIHLSLDIDSGFGLTNYLAGEAKPVDIALHTCVPRLFAIPAGPLPPNPAELLSSEKMKNLLEISREKFDCIVLDGPPVMGLADALVLASLADGTTVVVESGATRQAHLQAAVKRLQQTTNTTFVGAILSKYSPQGGSYDYYHDYYSYSRLDQADNEPKRIVDKAPRQVST